jgi:PUA-domain protein
MSDFKVRKRKRMRQKETKVWLERLREAFGGGEFWPEGEMVDYGELPDFDCLVIENQVRCLIQGDKPFLSLRGLLAYRPKTRWVTVDAGAIKFVLNGADIMSAGIVDADPELKEGDWCWVKEETRGAPLAIGRCSVTGPELIASKKGKGVKSVHVANDKLWLLDA